MSISYAAARHSRRRLIRLVLATVLALAGVGVLATTGSAHAQLVKTTPADGATLSALPQVAVLTFSDPLDPQFVRMRVVGPAQRAQDVTAPRFSVTGDTVSVALTDVGPGRYAVAYRVVSKDGHPVSGQITFTVGGALASTGTPTTAAPSTAPSTSTSTTAPSTAPSSTPATPGTVTPGTTPASAASSGPPVGTIAGIVAVVLALGGVAWFAVGRRTR